MGVQFLINTADIQGRKNEEKNLNTQKILMKPNQKKRKRCGKNPHRHNRQTLVKMTSTTNLKHAM